METQCRSITAILVVTLLALALAPVETLAQDTLSELQFDVKDSKGKALSCRIHLFDAANKPQQAKDLPFWRDHFVCNGQVALKLPGGTYRYEIERGPEHQRIQGSVELKRGRDHTVSVQLSRLANLGTQGWYAGDLHVHRPVKDIELLMQAEDLHVAPVITWWNKTNPWAKQDPPKQLLHQFDGQRFYHVMAGEDERGGGALLYFHLDKPLEISQAAREHPTAMKFAEAARKEHKQVWIDIEKPFWWDVPVWLAGGHMDSIGLANNHMCRSQMLANEAWGRARDERALPGPLGNGQWTQEIYYHLLNSGLRLPPSAGSASGVLPNPVGYNRVYVQVDGAFTYEKWWAGLKAGRSFVTNGPLLVCQVEDKLPGHVFQGAKGKPLDLQMTVHVTSADRVPKLEIIQNGRAAKVIDLDDSTSQQRTVRLSFQESGWFLVRAVTDKKETYRFASTAPYYVEIGDRKERISKRSVRFFLDWVNERIERLQKAGNLSDAERREVLESQEKAKQFWQGLLEKANAE